MDKFLKKSDQHLVVKENVPNQRKGTKWKFKEEYIEYGFIASGPEDAQIPYCLICNSALSNESLVPNKLKRHLETNHPGHKEKPREYFEKLATERNHQSKKITTYLKLPEKGLVASYKVAQLLAKKKAHSEGETIKSRKFHCQMTQCLAESKIYHPIWKIKYVRILKWNSNQRCYGRFKSMNLRINAISKPTANPQIGCSEKLNLCSNGKSASLRI